jgi:hypothetical protein
MPLRWPALTAVASVATELATRWRSVPSMSPPALTSLHPARSDMIVGTVVVDVDDGDAAAAAAADVVVVVARVVAEVPTTIVVVVADAAFEQVDAAAHNLAAAVD